MGEVIQLVSEAAVDRAYQDYCALVEQTRRDEALRTDPAHSIRIAKAWKRWLDLFLAQEG